MHGLGAMLLVAMLSFFLCSKSDKTFRNTGRRKMRKLISVIAPAALPLFWVSSYIEGGA
jgi:hypothetical protein